MPLIYLVAHIILFGLFKNNRLARLRYHRYLLQLDKRYRLRLEISKISINVTQGIILKGVCIQFKSLIIKIDFCLLKFSFTALFSDGLFGTVTPQLTGISIDQKKPVHYNFHNKRFTNKENVNWDRRFFLLFKRLGYHLFKQQIKLNIVDMRINYHKICVEFEKLDLTKKHIAFEFKARKDKEPFTEYQGKGSINSAEQKFTIQILRKTTEYSNLTVLFDEFEFSLHQTHLDAEIYMEFEMNFTNVQILDHRIHPGILTIDNIYLNFEIDSASDRFVIRENSGGSLGEIPFAFGLTHQYSENDILSINFSIEVNQKLFTSFHCFHNIWLSHLKVDGNTVLSFQLMFNMLDPFEYYFSVKPFENSLHITDLGYFDLSVLNRNLEQLLHIPFIRKQLLPRKIVNEVLTEQVADNFLTVIVACEDSSFYLHQGVDIDAVGYALVSNIAKKAFSRGASTITMQVARNLFLNHDKNVARKIEEVLITFIIEKHCKIPKKRILEIYINIIEFGPGIYGIDQASAYYFDKCPAQLSVAESIVLSYIVPRPKHFHEALLIKTPQLLENLPRYFTQISKILFFKNLISEDEFSTLGQEITFANGLGTIML